MFTIAAIQAELHQGDLVVLVQIALGQPQHQALQQAVFLVENLHSAARARQQQEAHTEALRTAVLHLTAVLTAGLHTVVPTAVAQAADPEEDTEARR